MRTKKKTTDDLIEETRKRLIRTYGKKKPKPEPKPKPKPGPQPDPQPEKFIHPLPDGHYSEHRLPWSVGYCGFDVVNGRIKLALVRVEPLRQITAEIASLRILQDNVNDFCSQRYVGISLRQDEWWRRIQSALDLPADWALDLQTGELYQQQPQVQTRKKRK